MRASATKVAGIAIFSAAFTLPLHAAVVFQDGFETYTGATNVTDTGDLDPGTPAIGGGAWTMTEQSAAHVQVYDSPVTGSAFDASGSDKFLHLTRNGDQGRAWAPISAYDSVANTQVVITARVYNAVIEGSGGNTGFMAFNNGVESFGSRLFDISFRANGSVIVYDGFPAGTDGDAVSTTISNAYNLNQWNDVRIDIDFVTDTYTLKINNIAITTNENWEGGPMSTFQHLLMDSGEATGAPNAGWDDIVVTAVPEPTSAAVVVAGIGAALLRRRHGARA